MFKILSILFVTYITGSIIEKTHFEKIKRKEIELLKRPVVTFGTTHHKITKPVKNVRLVTGEVVIAGDYFKNFVAGMKNLFGGRMTSLESVMDRARREAVIRMKEKAKNANIILNTRIETVMLNHVKNRNTVPKCAIIAYGTAVTYAE